MLTGFCLFFTTSIAAQQLRPPAHLATGAFSVTHSDLFSFTANPACLARMPSAAGGIYAERPYLLPELKQVIVAAAVPAGNAGWGVEAGYLGANGFHELKSGIAYGRSFGGKMDLAVQLNYHSAGFASGYGTAGAVSADAGALFKISEPLQAGLILLNPASAGFRKEGMHQIPSFYIFGLGYSASAYFHCSLSLVKENGQPAGLDANLQYRMMQVCRMRAGLSTSNGSHWIGVGFLFRKIRLDLTLTRHPQLGLTPGMLLQFGSGEEKKIVNGAL